MPVEHAEEQSAGGALEPVALSLCLHAVDDVGAVGRQRARGSVCSQAGSSSRSQSIRKTRSPRACASPVISALWCPKLRDRSMTRTCGSRACRSSGDLERPIRRAVVDEDDLVRRPGQPRRRRRAAGMELGQERVRPVHRRHDRQRQRRIVTCPERSRGAHEATRVATGPSCSHAARGRCRRAGRAPTRRARTADAAAGTRDSRSSRRSAPSHRRWQTPLRRCSRARSVRTDTRSRRPSRRGR